MPAHPVGDLEKLLHISLQPPPHISPTSNRPAATPTARPQLKSSVSWSSLSVTVHGGARNVEARNFLRTLYLNTEIAGDRYTCSMTLRLDTEAGKHRALKGETKLGN